MPVVAELLEIPIAGKYPSLTLTPERKKQRTLEVLLDQLAGIAIKQPVLAVCEDAHWIDPTTLELFSLLIERVQKLPVLVVITHRPEFISPWSNHAHVMQLSLTRLTRGHGEAMLERITHGKTLPPNIIDQILIRTDGVPLFIEELVSTVLESGRLADAGDHYELSGPLTPIPIPTTLHNSLMARLDRLAPIKEVAQIAAVIGREFAYEQIAAVSTFSDSQLAIALDQLVASGLIFRRGVAPNASSNSSTPWSRMLPTSRCCTRRAVTITHRSRNCSSSDSRRSGRRNRNSLPITTARRDTRSRRCAIGIGQEGARRCAAPMPRRSDT